MRHYETIYIANPNLGESEYRDVLTRYTSLIEKNKGVLIRTEEWGTQRLAHEVKKFDKGTYVLLNYCGAPGLTAELERDLNLNDRILKFQTMKIAQEVNPEDLLKKEREARKETVAEPAAPQGQPPEQPPEPPEAAAGAPVTESTGEEKGDA
jgi:small subunit ribosomal protein S6